MAGKTLADGYVELRADTTKLPKDVRKGIDALNLSKQGKKEGESFGASLASGAKDKIKGGLAAGLGAVGIGVGIGGALTSGITKALDIGAANDKLRAQLNLTAAESGRLGKAAGQLYSKGYGESIGEVNDAISSVVRNIPALRNASVPVLQDISGKALDIARVFDQDVGGVTAAVSTMLKSGLAKSADEAFDVLTKGFQSGANKADDLLDTFTEYSTQFTKLGLNGPKSLGVINQLLAGGARNADLAADAVKEFSLRSIDGSKGTVAAYKTLNLDAKATAQSLAAGGPAAEKAFDTIVDKLNAIKDPVKRNTTGVQLFGTKWEDLGSAIKNLDVSKATSSLGQVAGATKNLAADSDSARLNAFVRVVQAGFVSTIGGKVIPAVKEWAAVHKDQLNDALQTAAHIGRDILLPAAQQIGQYITGTLVPALASAANWVDNNSTTVKILAGLVVAGYVATKTWGAVTAIATGATKAWTAATTVAGGVKRAWNSTLITGVRIWAIDAAAWVRSTAVTVAHTVATTANRIAVATASGVQKAFVFVKNLEIGAWIRSTAMMVANTAATVASRVAMLAVRAATIAWTAVQWALNIALSANPIGLVVIGIAALIAAVILAYKKNETFRNIVNQVWAAIKVGIGATVDWFLQYVWPWLRKAIDGIGLYFKTLWTITKTVWSGIFTAISTSYGFIRDKVFSPLRNFITKTIPDAFRSGTAAIGKTWSGLQDMAKKPVRFIVDTVINQGIIGTFNKVSGFFGGPKVSPVSLPKGFGDGPGHGSAAPAGPRTGDGLGDMFGFAKGPADWFKGKVSGLLDKVGDNPFARMIKGMGGKLVGSAIDKAKSLLGGSEYSGGGVGPGGLQAGIAGALAALRSAFGSVPLISGFRPGAHTLSGNVSYHASGRAIDIAPVRAWAVFLNSAFGSSLKELITPWQDLNLHNGRPHHYTGAVWRQHNFAGGNAHIHAAMDDGGIRELKPGYNVIPNWTGKLEPIAGPNAMAALAGGGNTYNITVNVPVGANPAEVGRQTVEAIKAFEKANGSRWRS
ncbi:phage tail tape measure protein [Actinoplanes regularis]|uniref:phage tail tape measure protein n=1 Tax=Actinoplanes regularis TaxID=52697 RepID=UPI0024A5420E|nr:phage tail tape measure protein [Actinoplanes regularis]GLW32278.1 hypothetical protein Areg01_52170 [Actinoplanes regularis]